ncbi:MULTISPECIES: hypothetical protein [Paenibacillus]|uniref:hypothetical protein n=1 Tax=Paenibacillus TaxID=44249 RepID=UPI0029E7E8F5|nr:hypothetical protein [Paenibacillus caseinilyticus]
MAIISSCDAVSTGMVFFINRPSSSGNLSPHLGYDYKPNSGNNKYGSANFRQDGKLVRYIKSKAQLAGGSSGPSDVG